MTLDDAVAHVGKPVLIHTAPGRAADGQITAITQDRRMVGVRVRYKVLKRGWMPGVQWWAPVHPDVPAYWLERQKEQAR